MIRSFIFVAVIAITTALCSCEKNINNNAAMFYGTWTKGTNLGDTLWFMEKNNKPTMKYSASFNPALPMYTETEYKYENGKLSYKMGNDFFPMESFTWISEGSKFEIVGFNLYLFMSSMTRFTFTKIN